MSEGVLFDDMCSGTMAKCCDRDGRVSPMLRASLVFISMQSSWSSANTSARVHGDDISTGSTWGCY